MICQELDAKPSRQKSAEIGLLRGVSSSPAVKMAPPRAQELDLNKASEFALRSAKAAMTVVFEANALKPGDPGYVYDKKVRNSFSIHVVCSRSATWSLNLTLKVEFQQPAEPSDWD